MNPLLGRWISADPLAVHAPGEADLNVYAYVSGSVLKNIDPLGLDELDTQEAEVSEDGSEIEFGQDTIESTSENSYLGDPEGSTPDDALKSDEQKVQEDINAAVKKSQQAGCGAEASCPPLTLDPKSYENIHEITPAEAHERAVGAAKQAYHDAQENGGLVDPGVNDAVPGAAFLRLGKAVLKAGSVARVGRLSRSGGGQAYAAKVSEGGSGRAFAGHGELRFGSGETTVPQGTTITLPAGPGHKIADTQGRFMEIGDYGKVQYKEGAASFLPGAQIPNYTLKAPNNLSIMSRSTTVESATPLSTLLKPNMGKVDWAACTTCKF